MCYSDIVKQLGVIYTTALGINQQYERDGRINRLWDGCGKKQLLKFREESKHSQRMYKAYCRKIQQSTGVLNHSSNSANNKREDDLRLVRTGEDCVMATRRNADDDDSHQIVDEMPSNQIESGENSPMKPSISIPNLFIDTEAGDQ